MPLFSNAQLWRFCGSLGAFAGATNLIYQARTTHEYLYVQAAYGVSLAGVALGVWAVVAELAHLRRAIDTNDPDQAGAALRRLLRRGLGFALAVALIFEYNMSRRAGVDVSLTPLKVWAAAFWEAHRPPPWYDWVSRCESAGEQTLVPDPLDARMVNEGGGPAVRMIMGLLEVWPPAEGTPGDVLVLRTAEPWDKRETAVAVTAFHPERVIYYGNTPWFIIPRTRPPADEFLLVGGGTEVPPLGSGSRSRLVAHETGWGDAGASLFRDVNGDQVPEFAILREDTDDGLHIRDGKSGKRVGEFISLGVKGDFVWRALRLFADRDLTGDGVNDFLVVLPREWKVVDGATYREVFAKREPVSDIEIIDDWDGDGAADIAVSHADKYGRVEVFSGRAGTPVATAEGADWGVPVGVLLRQVADLNGDGAVDWVVVGNDGGRRVATFFDAKKKEAICQTPPAAQWTNAKYGDFIPGGKREAAIATGRTLHFFSLP
jgi:hypothetical protein